MQEADGGGYGDEEMTQENAASGSSAAGSVTLATSGVKLMVVSPGEIITRQSSNVLRGHGTYVDERDGTLRACVCGVVERVNKLITVRPLRSRYTADIGDVIVGRISEVSMNRWKVDVQGRQDAILLLSSVNLPGGI